MKVILEKAIKQLKKFPKNDAKKIKELENFPNVTNTKKLTNFYPPFRLRIGTYRALFDIENDAITIFEILKRKNAY